MTFYCERLGCDGVTPLMCMKRFHLKNPMSKTFAKYPDCQGCDQGKRVAEAHPELMDALKIKTHNPTKPRKPEVERLGRVMATKRPRTSVKQKTKRTMVTRVEPDDNGGTGLIFDGESLRTLRRTRGFSRRGLAMAVGMAQGVSIAQYERGISEPKATYLARIAMVLKVDMIELFGNRR